jgi:hypothetical protein
VLGVPGGGSCELRPKPTVLSGNDLLLEAIESIPEAIESIPNAIESIPNAIESIPNAIESIPDAIESIRELNTWPPAAELRINPTVFGG